MKASGHSQQWLADQLDVSKGAVSHWLNGTHQPSLARLSRIAALIGTTTAELLADDMAFVRDDDERALLEEFRAVREDRREEAARLIAAVLTTLKDQH